MRCPSRARRLAPAVLLALAVGVWPGDTLSAVNDGTIRPPSLTRSYTVCPSGCDYTAIQAAVSNAGSGDTINVRAGTYQENIVVNTDVIVTGEGAGRTIVDGGGQGSVFHIHNAVTVTLAKMTITRGTGTAVRLGFVNNVVGGGVFNQGTLVLDESLVEENSVAPPCSGIDCSSAGGGLFNHSGRVTVRGSTFTNNAAEFGGALYDWANGTLVIESSTISGNRADFSGGGVLAGYDTAIIVSATITNNEGGGVTSWTSQLSIGNTIIAANASGEDCEIDEAGPVQSLGYNLDGGTSCGFTGTGDLSRASAQLGLLDLNGGLTPTHALVASSAPVDAANPGGCAGAEDRPLATDQRGEVRVADGNGDGVARCDMGAFELAQMAPTATDSPSPTASATSTPTATSTAVPTQWDLYLPACRN